MDWKIKWRIIWKRLIQRVGKRERGERKREREREDAVKGLKPNILVRRPLSLLKSNWQIFDFSFSLSLFLSFSYSTATVNIVWKVPRKIVTSLRYKKGSLETFFELEFKIQPADGNYVLIKEAFSHEINSPHFFCILLNHPILFSNASVKI